MKPATIAKKASIAIAPAVVMQDLTERRRVQACDARLPQGLSEGEMAALISSASAIMANAAAQERPEPRPSLNGRGRRGGA